MKKKNYTQLSLMNRGVEYQLGYRVWPKTTAQHVLNGLEHYRDAISNRLTL